MNQMMPASRVLRKARPGTEAGHDGRQVFAQIGHSVVRSMVNVVHAGLDAEPWFGHEGAFRSELRV